MCWNVCVMNVDVIPIMECVVRKMELRMTDDNK